MFFFIPWLHNRMSLLSLYLFQSTTSKLSFKGHRCFPEKQQNYYISKVKKGLLFRWMLTWTVSLERSKRTHASRMTQVGKRLKCWQDWCCQHKFSIEEEKKSIFLCILMKTLRPQKGKVKDILWKTNIFLLLHIFITTVVHASFIRSFSITLKSEVVEKMCPVIHSAICVRLFSIEL